MASCRLGGFNSERKNCLSQDENFCVFNVFCVFISLVTILADLTTDILVLAEYCKNGQIYWALPTLIFMLLPNILINVFSIRWFMIDNNKCMKLWITHCFLVGLIERYIKLLHEVFWCKNFEAMKTQKLMAQRNDLTLLHFLYIFSGTLPQIILQTYAIITLHDNYQTKVFALAASISSVVWGFSTYIYNNEIFNNNKINWLSLFVKFLWQFAMLIGRIPAILLFTVIFGIWTLVPLGLHWSAMTFWIITQQTKFCPNKLEETMYNVVMGFVYCFSFVNLRDGFSRYRLMMYYTLTISQNFGSLFLYVLVAHSEKQKKIWSIAAIFCIVAGNVIGLCAMIIFYRYFHTKSPIIWNYSKDDIELNNKSVGNDDKMQNKKNIRSFKSILTSEDQNISKTHSIKKFPTDVATVDKKIIHEQCYPQKTMSHHNLSTDASSIEIYTVENTPMSVQDETKTFKKVTICSPTELTLKLSSIEDLESSIDEITSNNIIMQKRRGICSSDDLRKSLRDLNLVTGDIINEDFINTIKTDQISELSHGSNKKTSSDSIDMDLDLSFSDINSSDINTFNENIVQKLCLSALKNIKVGNQDADIENIQRIALDILKEMYTKKDRSKNMGNNETPIARSRDLDTPTELLSVHDYENICAVNIAREAWGLRSWNGYSDIENWLHDGSVVRDRSRDTFTSASSEISSCLSHELKNAILTAPSFPKRSHTYSNVLIKPERFNQADYVNTEIYQTNDPNLGRPFNMENGKDSAHLEPILEELDDLGDLELPSKKRLNSESSLVATIDEIRKATISNSPRNIYRRELSFDSPQLNACNKIDTNLKQALWKEPMNINSSNIMRSLPEKENILSIPCTIADTRKKEINIDVTALDGSQTDIRKLKTQAHLQDLSNKDIDFLWKLVSDHSLVNFSSSEDLSSNRMSTSLQSLIQRETPTSLVSSSTAKISNIIKGTKNKPRRKLSVLREKFEPRINSDEEILYSQNSSSDDITSISVIHQQESNKDILSRFNLKTDYTRKLSSNGTRNHVPDLITKQKSKESRVSFLNQMNSPSIINSNK